MSTLRRDSNGSTYMTGREGNEELLNPSVIRDQTVTTTRRSQAVISDKFKLVTVRRLTNQTLEDAQTQLENQRLRLESLAIRYGQSPPYPSPVIASEDDLRNLYAVYVDEDLYGTTSPVYIFYSPSNNIKCFITANDVGKDDWSIHVAHLTHQERNNDSTYTKYWRLYTVDNRLPESGIRQEYLFENTSLPRCFQLDFDIESVNYLGGGCWTGIGNEVNDRLPLYGYIPSNLFSRYILVGEVYRGLGQTKSMAITSYSLTPTYTFTWCRGKLKLSKRSKKFTQKADLNAFLDTGVITTDRYHEYDLDLCPRPDLTTDLHNIPEKTVHEYSYASARYVGNTNYQINSQFQDFDYGTDVKRLSIANYSMETNVVRPKLGRSKAETVDTRKVSYQAPCFLPMLAASYNMSCYLMLDMGIGKGSIDHPNQIKYTTGSRGYDYGDFYKYWWTYGKVLQTFATGDTNRYRLNKGTQQEEIIGSMFDLGELKIDEDSKNRVITTWEGRSMPQSGFFSIVTGRLTFTIVYSNPPIIGHDGVYYYNVQPPILGGYSSREFSDAPGNIAQDGFGGSFVSGGISNLDTQSRKNSLISVYSQMLGGLGGGFVSSLNIGSVTIASEDVESVVVRSPTPEMKVYFEEKPETFPVGFWEGDLLDIEVTNDNSGSAIAYNTDTTIQNTWNF